MNGQKPSAPEASLFLRIPVSRLIILSIVSFGLYEGYWVYKNWRYIKQRDRLDIRPFWRGLFAVFFCHSLLRRIYGDEEARSTRPPSFRPEALATAWVILWYIPLVPSVLCLLPVQKYINAVEGSRAPAQRYYGWSSGHVVCLAYGIVIWFSIILVFGGAVLRSLPPSRESGSSVFGERIDEDRVALIAQGLLPFVDERTDHRVLFALAYDTVVFDHEGRRQGVVIGEDRVSEKIRQFEADPEFGERVSVCGVSDEALREAVRVVLVREHLMENAARDVAVSEEDAWLSYSEFNKRVNARYLRVRAEDMAVLVEVDEAELADFFRIHAEKSQVSDDTGVHYWRPEMIKIEYVLAPYQQYEGEVEITDEQVREFYRERRSTHTVNSDPGEVQTDEGEHDSATAQHGNPRVTLSREVADEIRQELKQSEIKKLANAAIDELLQAWPQDSWGNLEMVGVGNTPTFAQMAAISGLKCGETPLFAAEDIPQVLPGATALHGLFGRPDMSRPQKMECDEGPFLCHVLEWEVSRAYRIEEVHSRVEKDYRKYAGMALAATVLEGALPAESMADAGKKVHERIAALILSAGLGPDVERDPAGYYTMGQTGFFLRPTSGRFWSEGIEGMMDTTNEGNSSSHFEFARTAFGSDEGELAIARVGGKVQAVFLLERLSTKLPERAEFDEGKADIMLLTELHKRQEASDAWFEDMKLRAAPRGRVLEYLELLPAWQETDTVDNRESENLARHDK